MQRRWASCRRRARAPTRRGVSDVIATILLLGLTVTLFAAIFFFVNSLPPPPAQAQNQFSSSLTLSGNKILTVQVTHLAGPVLAPTAQIYITSANNSKNNPPVFTVSQGLTTGGSWALGQVWTKDISSYNLYVPDNLTISIISQSVLLYRNTIPGASPNAPPNFIGVGYTPSNPTVGQTFTIFTQIISSNLNNHSVYVNISQLTAGLGKPTFPLTYSAATGLWSYVVPAGLTRSAGTFYVFINASDNAKQSNSVTIPITISPALGLISVSLTPSPVLLVTGRPVTLSAIVSNLAAGSGNMTVTFSAGSTVLATQSGVVPAGSSQAFSTSWTPATVGVYLLQASASVAGGGSASASINETVFPPILLLAHNVAGGTVAGDNTSAFLATELTAAGIPFSSAFVSCKTALASSLFTGYSVAIVDFGGNGAKGCPTGGASTTDESAITGASSTAVWVVGSNAFGATACTSYASAFFAKVGAKWTSGSTCGSVVNTTGTLAYTSTPASGLRGDGIPGSITVNKTLAGVSIYDAYNAFALGAVTSGGGSYAKVGTNVVGTFSTSSPRGASLATEPAQLAATLPSGSAWGTGVAGTAIVYNIVGYLSGLSNASATGRALSDFGIAQASLVGQSHGALSSVFVGVRANGPVAASVSVTLLVNGATALLGGSPVTATGAVTANGGFVFLTLVWQAPATGSYTLSVALTVSGVTDLDLADGQLGLSVINQPIAFA